MLVVKLQLPAPSTVVVPSEIAPSKTSTTEFASAVPLRVGVLSDVMLSVFDEPVSLPAFKLGSLGATGALVSTVIGKTTDVRLVLPAVSVAVAEML